MTGSSSSIGVLVLSYNRPRWLREALLSVQGADQIVVVDDGSDFDVVEVLQELSIEATVVRNGRISAYDRVRRARMGALFNRGLDAIRTTYVGYLCDDDVFAPGWPAAARAYLDEHPEAHMVRGGWNILGSEDSCFDVLPVGPWLVTTGNFVHRQRCYLIENCRWNEESLAVQDALFLTDYLRIHNLPHGGRTLPHIGVLAGWRREHDDNLMHFTGTSLGFGPGAEAWLDSGWLEAEKA